MGYAGFPRNTDSGVVMQKRDLSQAAG